MAAETFARWGLDPGQSELACLLVSEVVTNVVLHAALSPSPRRELVFDSAAVGGGPMVTGLDDGWELGRVRRRSPCPPGRVHCPVAARRVWRSGWRCSTQTCGCRGFAMLARTTREDAGSTSWTSFRAAGVPGRPRTARRSGSRCLSAAPRVIGRTRPPWRRPARRGVALRGRWRSVSGAPAARVQCDVAQSARTTMANITMAAVQCLPVTPSPARRRSRVQKKATRTASRASRIRPGATAASKGRRYLSSSLPPHRREPANLNIACTAAVMLGHAVQPAQAAAHVLGSHAAPFPGRAAVRSRPTPSGLVGQPRTEFGWPQSRRAAPPRAGRPGPLRRRENLAEHQPGERLDLLEPESRAL